MNPERYMVTALPVGGGERLTGYLVEHASAPQLWVKRDDGTWNYIVDPATIEPVPSAHWIFRCIAGEDTYECGACGNSVGVHGYKFCSSCGARMESAK